MIITCEACGTSFKIKTSLINETGSTVRCSKCQQVFIAYPKTIENEKSTDFALDKSLEEKIDDVLGDEFDDEIGDEFDDEFSDLESEISLETAEISMSTSEEETSKGLFATVDSDLDDMEDGFAEPEIMMAALEEDDNDILSLDALASGVADEDVLDLGTLLEDDDDDDDEVLDFGDLGAKATVEDDSEILSFDDIDQDDGEITLDDLESTSDLEEEEIGLEDLGSGEIGQEDILVGETIEEDDEEDKEEDIDF
ncbi:MAG: zinc-ribbon domain-containing protein [Desulfobacteraceae bacterium]|jgi:predicted Zn finger-like uncharacterized protein|nr:zinc-ribbon domain-containing protein [Desulfobacteraceae bacterium]